MSKTKHHTQDAESKGMIYEGVSATTGGFRMARKR